jgi:hypothetical protein
VETVSSLPKTFFNGYRFSGRKRRLHQWLHNVEV